MQDLTEKLRLFVDNQKRIKEAENNTHGTEANIRACISQAEKLLKHKSFERKSAYEKYVDEMISKDEFMAIKAKLMVDEEKLNKEIENYRNELKIIVANKNDSMVTLTEKAEDYISRECLTNDMMLYFIDKVNVYSGGKIEIVYRFKDIFENAMKTE